MLDSAGRSDGLWIDTDAHDLVSRCGYPEGAYESPFQKWCDQSSRYPTGQASAGAVARSD